MYAKDTRSAWPWIALAILGVSLVALLVQPSESETQVNVIPKKKAVPLQAGASTGNQEGLIERKPSVVLDHNQIVPSAPLNENILALVSEAGLSIEAVWIRVAGEWRIEKLESPGKVSLDLIKGADLIAPVGHIPEHPDSSHSSMYFSPWAMVEIRGAPESWLNEASASVPSELFQKDLWQFCSFGDSGMKTWSCAVQPMGRMMDAPNFQLSARKLSLTISGPEEIVLDLEISLARGARLGFDYQSIRGWVERVDIPILFLGKVPDTSWSMTVVEHGVGKSTLPDPIISRQAAGQVKHKVLRRRVLDYGSGDRLIIPGVKVGATLSFLAKSSDSTWFSFHSEFVVGKDSEVILSLEDSYVLHINGLNNFGDKVDQLGLEWSFYDFNGQEVRNQTNRISTVFQLKGDELDIHLSPTLEQMWRLSRIDPGSLWINIVVSNEGLYTSSHHVAVPLSKELQINIQDIESKGVAVKIGKDPESLAGAKWVSFAIDHEPHQENAGCNTTAIIAAIEEGGSLQESIVLLVSEEDGSFPQGWLAEMPEILTLDWSDRSRYYERGVDGIYEELETRSLEIEFRTRGGSGPWGISWCFGCESNTSFPLSYPLTTGVLPKRVEIEVPIQHAYLLVNGSRLRALDELGPITQFLE